MKRGLFAATFAARLAAATLLVACSAPEPPPRAMEVRAPTALVHASAEPLMALEDLPTAPLSEAIQLRFPYLDGESVGASVSIGDTTHGRLVNGRELVETSALKILPKQKERDLRYGTDSLVALLDHAGKALFSRTQTPVWVGNLGRRDGGDIEWSVSHNAGRDADVAFCYRDVATGKPADPPDLVQVLKDGKSKDKKLAFDAPRTWIVVRSLLEFEGASLQYLFISDGLKKKLLEHARTIKEPAALIARASELLRQPGAAAAHDDHLHVRIYCGKLDAAGGCRDIGVVHPFARRHDAERDKAATKAREQLVHPLASKRRTALLRLALVGTVTDVPSALASLDDTEPEVRSAAAELVRALGSDEHSGALIARFREESDSVVLATLVDAIGFLGGKEAGPFFRDILLATASAEVLGFSARSLPLDVGTAPLLFGLASDPYPPMRVLLAPMPAVDVSFDRSMLQRLAVKAVRHSRAIEPVDALVDLLGSDDMSLAMEAAESLAFLTNQRLLESTSDKSPEVRLREAKVKYEKLIAALGKSVRDGWLVHGFASRGYKVRGLDKRSSWELLRAVADEPHVSYNARSVLARLFGQPREVAYYGAGDGCRVLYHLLRDRRSELHLARPNAEQRTACWRARSREKETLALE